ncbi:uncharacterized protein [Triticum aestivum]|uniref:uncharacterized protein n=1 Tax=Triticum aestivum TaxID=4565 RepID=UPI001D0124D4|nr:uncharacterized protein LOC123057178 [Triticum aestivum]
MTGELEFTATSSLLIFSLQTLLASSTTTQNKGSLRVNWYRRAMPPVQDYLMLRFPLLHRTLQLRAPLLDSGRRRRSHPVRIRRPGLSRSALSPRLAPLDSRQAKLLLDPASGAPPLLGPASGAPRSRPGRALLVPSRSARSPAVPTAAGAHLHVAGSPGPRSRLDRAIPAAAEAGSPAVARSRPISEESTGKVNLRFWHEELKRLFFYEFRGTRSEVTFLKFVAERARVLEKMVVVVTNDVSPRGMIM